MELAQIRNLGVVAHIDAGKTTVTERLLFCAGVEHRIGEVDDGTATMDWMPEERERGITITAAATTLPWREHQLNLIDTPGHVDFTVEVERSLRVLDGAVLVIDAVAGVQAQSETVWRQMQRHRVPAIAFVNKCDRPGADFLAAVESLGSRLGARAVALHYPLFRDGALIGLVDLLTRRAFDFSHKLEAPKEPPREVPVGPEVADELGVLRGDLLEALSEDDDAILKAVVEEREVALDVARAALRKRTVAGTLLPVLCGAALRNVGIEPLLDAIVDYLPAPSDVPAIVGRHPQTGAEVARPPLADGPCAALAFKLHAEAHGDLTFLRVYSGTLHAGDALLNPRVKHHERLGRLLRMHADERTQIDSAGPGEIIAVTGPKLTATGDTLCSHQAPVVFESLAFPEPVISMVVEPRSTLDRDKLRTALVRLQREDPTFHQREDESTGQWTVSGMGELHLEVMLHRLKSESRVDAAMGMPRVAYREALTAPALGAGRVDRVLDGKNVFGAVEIQLAPAEASAATNAPMAVRWSQDCPVPKEFRAAVESALRDEGRSGPRLGFPLVQAEIAVVGGESRPRLDAESGFVQAAALAVRTALARAEVEVLEPVMRFEIQAPAEFASGVIADLNARHAEVSSVQSSGTWRVIQGQVPLVHMFGYSTAVRSLSQGRASFSMQPAGFQAVPEVELRARGMQ